MKIKREKLEQLKTLFEQERCLTINEICFNLDCSRKTARNYLRSFEYYSSYSHNSKWYTIAPIPKFNRDGLWNFNLIYFSKYGTLKNMIAHFVEESRSGLTAGQLFQKLGIACYSALNQFYKSGIIDRLKTSRGFVYLSKNDDKRQQQLSVLIPLERLAPQTAVLVLIEYIKFPQASFADISRTLRRHHNITVSIEAIEQFFKSHNIKKKSDLIGLIHFYRQQLQVYYNPFNFFENVPIIKFMPEIKICPVCGRKLTTLKTDIRTIHSIGIGTFRAHHTRLGCKDHPKSGPWSCEDLNRIVPPNGNFAYDVIVEIGNLRFFQYRQIQEIQTILQEKYAIPISEKGVELLAEKFVWYLSVVHENSAELIKEHIQSRGGYILHIDCTCEGDSPKLASSIDELSGFVLHSVKLRTENKDDIVKFLSRILELYGPPLLVISDMSIGMISAVKVVFDGVAHYICHYHFLKNAGDFLFEVENRMLYKKLSKVGISGRLKKFRRELEKQGHPLSVEQIEKYLETTTELPAETTAYYLILWVLDHASDGNGYGFPFDQTYLQFYFRIKKAEEFIDEIIPRYSSQRCQRKLLCKLRNLFREISQDSPLKRVVKTYSLKLDRFQELRQVLKITSADDSNGLRETGVIDLEVELKSIKTQMIAFCENLNKQIKRAPNKEISKSYGKLHNYIQKYWDKLFCDPLEVQVDEQKRTIFLHRTNNILEQHFRSLYYGYRRVQGNGSVKKHLVSMPEALPIVMNLKNIDYLKLVFGDEFKIAQKFAEVDVTIIRQKQAEKKNDKNHNSKKIKKIIRKSDFLKRLKGCRNN